ncbi:MAG: hypothetical protein JEZ04_11060 [Spirochaetales bacterium]|nr:hypothetical protein [Spirochaetales bacterium]
MASPLLIFSDSNALIGNIQYVFKDILECVSSDSLEWIEQYLTCHDIKLLIADMDMELNAAARNEVLEGLKEYRNGQTSFLFLVSEKRKLEIERDYEDLSDMVVSADWLIKPFSRDNLVFTVGKLCG